MAFDHIDTWVFDLDNTLYNADAHVFPRMGQLMDDYVARALALPMDRARVVRRDFFLRYGTTLRGLMTEHGVEPDGFLREVHDFDLSAVPVCDITADALARLPGRRVVFTNAPRHFARRMLDHLQLAPHIDAIFAVEDADYWPKPRPETYDRFLQVHGIDPARAAMVEDMEVNLAPAHARGMTTIWLHGENEPAEHAHVHHRATRLPDFFGAHPFFSPHKKAMP